MAEKMNSFEKWLAVWNAPLPDDPNDRHARYVFHGVRLLQALAALKALTDEGMEELEAHWAAEYQKAVEAAQAIHAERAKQAELAKQAKTNE